MWPWRDWVVAAFNDNLPFDKFTVWQLAGDLLPKPTREQTLATAFNRNHMINGEGGRIAEENRIEYVFDQTETTGTIWLGLTVGCARCHDHKFDPVTQKDYYSLFAYFNQTPVNGGGGSGQTAPVLDFATPEQEKRRKDATAAYDAMVKEVVPIEAKLREAGVRKDKDGKCDDAPADHRVGLRKGPNDRADQNYDELISISRRRNRPTSNGCKICSAASPGRGEARSPDGLADHPKPRDIRPDPGAYDKPAAKVGPATPPVCREAASGEPVGSWRTDRVPDNR